MSVFNLRRMSTSTTGTGTITLGSAVTGFKAFADSPAIPDQTWVTYAIADTNASEIGYGLYSTSGTTLTRQVIESTNSDSPLNLSGSAQVFITSSAGDLQSNTAFPNRLRNGNMDIWQRGTATQTVSTSGAYAVDGWIVVPTGASVTVDQVAGRSLTAYAQKITGAASVTDVVIKQRIESYIAAAMTSQQVVFQAQVFNNTGGQITPTLTIKHPTATDNYSSTATDVNAASLQPCANGAWTMVMYTFTASSSSALGMELSIDFGNNFSTTGKSIQITECDLRVAPGYASGLAYLMPYPQLRPIHEELLFCQRYYQKSYSQSVAPGASTTNGWGGATYYGASLVAVTFPQVLRSSSPTFTAYDNTGASGKISWNNGSWNNNGAYTTPATADRYVTLSQGLGATFVNFDWTVSAEL